VNDYSRSDQIVRFRIYEPLAVEMKSALGGTISGNDAGVKTVHIERWLGEDLPLGNRWQSYLMPDANIVCPALLPP
jgi:hypothetical protein